MIDDMVSAVALTAALTAVTIVIRGLPPSGKVSLLRYSPDLNPSSNFIPIWPQLPNLSQSKLGPDSGKILSGLIQIGPDQHQIKPVPIQIESDSDQIRPVPIKIGLGDRP